MFKLMRWVLSFILFFTTPLASKPLAALKYCTAVSKVDLNPFRKIIDGKDMTYLLLILRPIIDTEDPQRGILSAFYFSPDGLTFRAKLNENLKWSDGQKVHAKDVAYSIAKALRYRPLGQRIKILGSDGLDSDQWMKNTYRGIVLTSPVEFELKFETTIDNPSGVLREALSSGSAHNLIWPVRLAELNGKQNNLKESLRLITNNPIRVVDGHIEVEFNMTWIRLNRKSECGKDDFFIYPEFSKFESNQFTIDPSPFEQTITAQMNLHVNGVPNIFMRKAIALWVRQAFKELPHHSGTRVTPSHFVQGEPGYESSVNWDLIESKYKLDRIRVSAELPVFVNAIQAHANKTNVKVTFVEYPPEGLDFDLLVLSTGNQAGRQVFLQDLLAFDRSRLLLKNAPKTLKRLQTIAKTSASTIPPTVLDLKQFEKSAFEEVSIIPIGRRTVLAFSRTDLPFELGWRKDKQLIFRMRKKDL
jgi:hypothetical protein